MIQLLFELRRVNTPEPLSGCEGVIGPHPRSPLLSMIRLRFNSATAEKISATALTRGLAVLQPRRTRKALEYVEEWDRTL
jgi:hypothetical protein